MTDSVFVDTNILVYAHDLDAGLKNEVAVNLVSQLWESRKAVLSTQVLQELYVVLTRKVARTISRLEARKLVRSYCQWKTVVNDSAIIVHASEIEESYDISFWDALIVSSAYSQHVPTILTEDLKHNQYIEGILISNPFVDYTGAGEKKPIERK
jgi:predicted nucleic acid-binding protein